MVIEKIKLRNIADLSIDKVHRCYFDEENLQVIDVMKNTFIRVMKA